MDRDVLAAWSPFWTSWIIFLSMSYALLLVVFFYRRHSVPIKYMRPNHLLVANTFGFLFSVTLSNIYRQKDMKIFYAIVIPQAFLSLFCDMFAVIALGLYLAFSRTREQVQYMDGDLPTSSARRIATYIRIFKLLTDDRTAAMYLFVNVFIQVSIQVQYALAHPTEIFALVEDGFDEPEYFPVFASIGAKKVMICSVIYCYLALRLRIVVDVHGIKRNLMRSGILSLSGCVVFFSMVEIFGKTGYTSWISN